MSLLELKKVEKIYQQGKIEVPALKGVDLTVEKGEFTTIFGPSGSGKTTMLNMIGCLDKPTSGELFFDKKKLNDMSTKELAMLRRFNIGFIFQSYNLIPVLSAYENVEFAIRLTNVGQKEMEDRVMDLLEAVGLGDMADRRPNELSGGQKQRVAIARALVKEPKLVLADEPTANLDSKTSDEVLEIMLKMNKKLGTTFIFSTHDPQVMDYASRLIEIKDGNITEDKETKNDEQKKEKGKEEKGEDLNADN
ncbi:MAG: ABC transporter ATP-binding protein [Halanaerobiales bacterium]